MGVLWARYGMAEKRRATRRKGRFMENKKKGLLYPRYMFSRVWDITAQWLRGCGITTLLLDVDNTLTLHNAPEVPKQVSDWIDCMRDEGVLLLLLSNNSAQRVEPFAKKIGLGFVANAKKPLGSGVRRAARELGARENTLAVVGDQIFTDVLCANLAGVTSILVEPMQQESMAFFKFKRSLEKKVLRNITAN